MASKPVELLLMGKRDFSASYLSSFASLEAAEKGALKRYAATAAEYPSLAWETVYVIVDGRRTHERVYIGIPDETGSMKRGREWADAIRSGEIAPRRLSRGSGFEWKACESTSTDRTKE